MLRFWFMTKCLCVRTMTGCRYLFVVTSTLQSTVKRVSRYCFCFCCECSRVNIAAVVLRFAADFTPHREALQAVFAEAVGLQRGEPGVDALRAKLRSRQADLQLSMAAADAVVKETIR